MTIGRWGRPNDPLRVDGIQLNAATHTVQLRAAHRSATGHAYRGESFIADLTGPGITITRTVFMYPHDWDALTSYFDDLADNGLDSPEPRVWRSPEGDLQIDAHHDAVGRWRISLTIQNGPTPDWRTILTGLEIESGEDMGTTAETVRAWIESAVD